eukprot:CAMPEP_0168380590 /NCGR_PEP_ID=MMETSP0228-20121227/12440_1 /TAXON_ID=133427 /ORGANISM="Protoceratium reticulatum, Strain CCCM 535 (=CCMP 1889)" /LENGTH=225 /DNA_ID=CAMNT_0008393663 /DNA_START=327 /DNA_END=1005 /DNA_ORIENTATION=+
MQHLVHGLPRRGYICAHISQSRLQVGKPNLVRECTVAIREVPAKVKIFKLGKRAPGKHPHDDPLEREHVECGRRICLVKHVRLLLLRRHEGPAARAYIFLLAQDHEPKVDEFEVEAPVLVVLDHHVLRLQVPVEEVDFLQVPQPFAISLISRATFGAVSQSVRRSSSALPSTEPTLTNLSSSSSLPQSSRCNQIISSVWFSSKVNPVSGDTFGPDMLKHFMNLSL